MSNDKHITRVTADQARAKVGAGQSRTDWDRVKTTSDEELDRRIADDPDEGPAHLSLDWSKATVELPRPKQMVNLRLDPDVLEWYRGLGKGYQTRINAVLRAYKQAHEAR